MKDTKILFCVVNDIKSYKTKQIQTTIQNILDFTISNLYTKGYDVIVREDEDELLSLAADYDYAVVMSPGTEYINGFAFFDELDNICKKDFFLAGHILDRSNYNAYYELHHQCYIVNMDYYKKLNRPFVGKLEKNNQHVQLEPIRSKENYHDDYTPKYISKGNTNRTYRHKCHGWNLLRLAFENDYPIIVFDDNIRNSKKHYYPEVEEDYSKHIKHIDEKFNYCKTQLIHKSNTEWTTGITEKYEQIVLPASGMLYLDLIDSGRVVFYDYNKRALDYWKENVPRKDNIEYTFVHTNLLEELSIVDYIDPNLKTLVNLSNIFCYEGTAAYFSLQQRKSAQDKLQKALTDNIKNIDINFTLKADAGH